jgi:hypothetical protein
LQGRDGEVGLLPKMEDDMAAQSKSDSSYQGVHSIRSSDFNRLVKRCENAPKASPALKAFMAGGKVSVKKG